jgi:hypothetical protein
MDLYRAHMEDTLDRLGDYLTAVQAARTDAPASAPAAPPSEP